MPATSLTLSSLRSPDQKQLVRLFSGLVVAAPRALRFSLASQRQLSLAQVQATALRSKPRRSVIAMATQAASANGAADPVAALRKIMAQPDKAVQAYIVPSEDPHMSEYPPKCHERRHFISNFTGSAGVAVITSDRAALWTDGRYFLQAEQQLEKGWELMKAGTPGCPEIDEWLVSVLPEGSRIGIDPFLHTVAATRNLQQKLTENKRQLVPLLGGNLVDAVWGSAQPSAPTAAMRVHPQEYAGQAVPDKLKELLQQMEEAKAEAMLVTAIDEVAWVLNLRGADVDYNPVFVSYLVVTPAETTLYVDPQKVTPEVGAHLKACSVTVKPYEDLLKDVQSLASAKKRLWIDPAKVNYAIYQAAKEAAAIGTKRSGGRKRKSTEPAEPPALPAMTSPEEMDALKQLFAEKTSPVTIAKAIKNEAELQGMREAHLRDGVALAKLFHGLEKQLSGTGNSLTEVEVDDQLRAARAAQPGFIDYSFPTIAGAGPNGAIIHYRAQPGTCRSVDGETLLLLDSGAQFDCGTTDVTRTVHFGEPKPHQQLTFTRVLQGHIALDQAVFPEGTSGLALDTLARRPLWSLGLNYRHGTGHGVGAALNVHEGPHSISSRATSTTPMQVGMVVSNEPGYYEDGAFGIRIENLLITKEADTPFRYAGQTYMCFEPLTFCPIQRKMLALKVLSASELDWLNEYHQAVWDKISPHLQDDPDVLEWLRTNTQPISAPAAEPATVAA